MQTKWKGVMRLWVRFLKLAIFGFLLGIVIGNMIAWFSGGLVSPMLLAWTGDNTVSVVMQSVLSGLYGAAAFAGMMLYEIESWPLRRCTFVHYLIVAGLYIPMALLLGWWESWTDILIVEIFQAAAFFLIWIIMYERYKKQVQELNKLQERMREEEL